jgi:hypothetical protein
VDNKELIGAAKIGSITEFFKTFYNYILNVIVQTFCTSFSEQKEVCGQKMKVEKNRPNKNLQSIMHLVIGLSSPSKQFLKDDQQKKYPGKSDADAV